MDAPSDGRQDGAPDLSIRTFLSYFGRSPRVKWTLPVGLLAVVRMVMMWGVLDTALVVVGMVVVLTPVGYVLWRRRGGGPDPGY